MKLRARCKQTHILLFSVNSSSVARVREWAIPTERLSPVGEVSANVLQIEGCHVVIVTDPYDRNLGFSWLDTVSIIVPKLLTVILVRYFSIKRRLKRGEKKTPVPEILFLMPHNTRYVKHLWGHNTTWLGILVGGQRDLQYSAWFRIPLLCSLTEFSNYVATYITVRRERTFKNDSYALSSM
jgi:hypothetical protein